MRKKKKRGAKRLGVRSVRKWRNQGEKKTEPLEKDHKGVGQGSRGKKGEKKKITTRMRPKKQNKPGGSVKKKGVRKELRAWNGKAQRKSLFLLGGSFSKSSPHKKTKTEGGARGGGGGGRVGGGARGGRGRHNT